MSGFSPLSRPLSAPLMVNRHEKKILSYTSEGLMLIKCILEFKKKIILFELVALFPSFHAHCLSFTIVHIYKAYVRTVFLMFLCRFLILIFSFYAFQISFSNRKRQINVRTPVRLNRSVYFIFLLKGGCVLINNALGVHLYCL